MNIYIRKYAIILYSLLFLMTTISLSKAEVISVGYKISNPVFSLESKEEEVEKIIANVKVLYNPVAEQISVSFKLTKQSNVSIKLMDALGNEVLVLSNAPTDSGNHNLSFDTDGKVTPGFYFVRVASGTETVVKRVSVR